MTDSKMEAEIIFEPHIPDALRRALEYAGDDDHPFGYDTKYGLSGNESLFGMSRYVAVAPRDVSTDLRHLDFEV